MLRRLAFLVAMGFIAAGVSVGVSHYEQPTEVEAANSVGSDLYLKGAPTRVYNSIRQAGTTSYVRVAYKPANVNCFSGAHVNITLAEASQASYAVAWGPGNKPETSWVNVNPGFANSNAGPVQTYVSAGSLYFKVYSLKRQRVIVDLMGFYLDC